MRHKPYAAIGEYIRRTPLNGTVKVDGAFTGINHKDTKTKNIPRTRYKLNQSQIQTTSIHGESVNTWFQVYSDLQSAF